jgi:hypothetical protein
MLNYNYGRPILFGVYSLFIGTKLFSKFKRGVKYNIAAK